jgi:hypothetical protein
MKAALQILRQQRRQRRTDDTPSSLALLSMVARVSDRHH